MTILNDQSETGMRPVTVKRSPDYSTPLSSLTAATAKIGRARTIEAVVETIRDTARSLIGCEGIAVIRRDGDLCHYVEEDAVGPLWKGSKFPISACISGWAMIHKQTTIVPDISKDDRIPFELYEKTFVRAVAMSPVLVEDPVGAIGAYWAEIYEPSRWEIEVLESLASAAATAIEHINAMAALSEHERELAELREQFIAVLGHDLRNPIAAVSAGTSRLLSDGWTERSPLILNLMRTSLDRMSGLVDNVMDLTRARLGGGIPLNLTERDIAETLDQIIEELRIAHPEREITVNLGVGRRVNVDHFRVAQMFSNLIANAITHGAQDKPIRITGRVDGGNLDICVINAGKPIPADKLDKLFQPFRRGETSSNMKGLGLGLYIASQIAQAHGGTITATSDETETCFTFTLPLH